jgi:hypothetical protein
MGERDSEGTSCPLNIKYQPYFSVVSLLSQVCEFGEVKKAPTHQKKYVGESLKEARFIDSQSSITIRAA